MLLHQFQLLSTLSAVLVLLAALVLYVYYSTDRHYRLKLLLGPALLGGCAVSFVVVGSRLGYAWPSALPESFEYMAHRAVVVDERKRWVDVLLVSLKPLQSSPRLHRVPWSQQIEDALEQAQSMREDRAGGQIVMEGQAGAAGRGDAYPEYVPKRVLPRQQNPKDEVQPQPAPRHGPAPRTQTARLPFSV